MRYLRIHNFHNATIPLTVITVISYLLSIIYGDREITTFHNHSLIGSIFSDLPYLSDLVSILLALIMVTLTSLSIYLTANKIMLDKGSLVIVPISYAFLISFSPYSIYFNEFHIVAFLVTWAIFHVIKFRMDERNLEPLFLSIFFISVASMLWTPIIWLIVMLFLINIFTDINKLRYILIVASGIIAPYIVLNSLIYLFGDINDVIAIWDSFKEAITNNYHFGIKSSVECMIYLGVTILISLIGIVRISQNITRFKIITERAYIRIILVFIATLVLAIIYSDNIPNGTEVILYVPATFILIELLSSNIKQRFAYILYALLFTSLIVSHFTIF